MPLYDFECPHEHRFDHICSIAERETPVPCEGTCNDLIIDDDLVAQYSGEAAPPLPPDLEWVSLPVIGGADLTVDGEAGRFLVRKVPCRLEARLVMGKHNNPGGALAHNAAANRDAAREGRYDPANPNRNFMSKGRTWRK